MKHEITDVLSTKVDPKCDTGKRIGRISIPVWHVDRVEELPGDPRRLLVAVDFKVALSFHQEMKLMKVKFVVLHRTIFYRPLLDGSLGRGKGGAGVRVEHLFRLPFHIHKEKSWVGWISLKNTSRLVATGAAVRPANRFR